MDGIWATIGGAFLIAAILAVGWVQFRNTARKTQQEAQEETLAIVTAHRDELLSLVERLQREKERADAKMAAMQVQIDQLTLLVTKSADVQALREEVKRDHQDIIAHIEDVKGLLGGQRRTHDTA